MWLPHTFWPCLDSTEDTTVLIWAHPTAVPEAMDLAFFQNILMYVSNVHERKTSTDPFQIMLMQ